MSRTSAIQHPAQSIYHTLRADYVAICDNAPDSTCAALILDLFTYWTDNVLSRSDNTDGWFYRSEASIAKDLFGIFGINKLRDNRKWLEQKFIESKKTTTATGIIHHYRLQIQKVQSAVDSWVNGLSEITGDGALDSTDGCVKSNDINKGTLNKSKKDYASNPADSNRETSSTDLKPNPAQMKLLQALTRRWIKHMTCESKGVDLVELGSCMSNGWIEQKQSWDYVFQIRLTEAGKAIKSPAKPKADPSVQEKNRALADSLALAMDVKPVGKDYGNFIKVARDLNDAGIKPAKFQDYVRYVHGLSVRQGGWDVTVNSLTANGRMSEYMARKNPNRKSTDPNAPVDMGRMVANPPKHDQYGNPFVEGKI